MAREEPLAVVALPEGEQRLAEFLDRGEVLHPEELFFQGADEALGAAVALRFSHEGGTAGDAQEPQFGLEELAHELAPMIMPEGQPGGDRLPIGPEVGVDPLPQGLQGFETSAAASRMDA